MFLLGLHQHNAIERCSFYLLLSLSLTRTVEFFTIHFIGCLFVERTKLVLPFRVIVDTNFLSICLCFVFSLYISIFFSFLP